jgi:hypothetical protein
MTQFHLTIKSLKKSLLFFFFLFFIIFSYSQGDQLVIYPNGAATPHSNPSFEVKVKQGNGAWNTLFQNQTFVNSDSPGSGFTESAFVQFDFSGSVDIEITSVRPISSIKIRPLSSNINYQQNGNVILFTLTEPRKLSFEINGDRHNNVHIFANSITAPPPVNHITVNDMNQNMVVNPYVSEWNDRFWYKPPSNSVIYIAPGEIFEGSILLDGVENVQIIGRGTIDLSRFDKNYDQNNIPISYDYLRGIEVRNSKNIHVSGITINDPQHNSIRIYQSEDVVIDDIKTFSRVIWGDGIHIVASSDITINNCFLRNSDDTIAIYANRVFTAWGIEMFDGNTRNVNVSNCSLYADVAHAIEIGWHGLQEYESDIVENSVVELINFNQIDILEHDEHGIYEDFHGAIGINCGDNNYCQFISFKDVRVEDFTNGSLFVIEVEPAQTQGANDTDGYRIHNVLFENLEYNHSGNEADSRIRGLSNCRYVSGVKFKNFVINNQLITENNPYDKLVQNTFAYDITFEESFSYHRPSNGYYEIFNLHNSLSLDITTEEFDDGDSNSNNNVNSYYVRTSPWGGKWLIEELEKGVYTLQSNYYNTTGYLTQTWRGKWHEQSGVCYDYHLITKSFENLSTQKWRFIDTGQGIRIVSAYDFNYSISDSPIATQIAPSTDYAMAIPWKHSQGTSHNSEQRWILVPESTNDFQFTFEDVYESKKNEIEATQVIVSNVIDDNIITIDNSTLIDYDSIEILSLTGALLQKEEPIAKGYISKVKLNASYEQGMYLLRLSYKGRPVLVEKFIIRSN